MLSCMMPGTSSDSGAAAEIAQKNGELHIVLRGRLDIAASAPVWKKVSSALKAGASLRAIQVDAVGLTYCDGGGISVLLNLERAASDLGIPFRIEGLASEHEKLMQLFPLDKLSVRKADKRKNAGSFIDETGRIVCDILADIRDHVAFFGELSVCLVKTLFQPGRLRLKDFFGVADASGVRALPIIGLLGLLVGLIMAYQGKVMMAQFGAEIYVADFVGISVTRELGPLITAIIVAGRTGSAFAAELGTMKVNEELDAFTTMGLDPVQFLVIPRVTAATLMTPLLTIFTNLAGLIGGAIVMIGSGFPLITYVNRATAVVSSTDFMGGLFKSLVFGWLVAASGCLCGLRTGEGASAVGASATRAVVISIVLIVVADGVFAVLFNNLGI